MSPDIKAIIVAIVTATLGLGGLMVSQHAGMNARINDVLASMRAEHDAMRAEHAEIRTDLRRIDDRLRAVEILIGPKPDQPAE